MAENEISTRIGFDVDNGELNKAKGAFTDLERAAGKTSNATTQAVKAQGGLSAAASQAASQVQASVGRLSGSLGGLGGVASGVAGQIGGIAPALFEVGSGLQGMLPQLGALGPVGIAAGVAAAALGVAMAGLQSKFAEAQAAANSYASSLDAILELQYGGGTLEDARVQVDNLNRAIQIQTEKLSILTARREDEFESLVQSYSAFGPFADFFARMAELLGGGGRGAYDDAIDETKRKLKDAQVQQESWTEAIRDGRFETEAATQAQQTATVAQVQATQAITQSAAELQRAATASAPTALNTPYHPTSTGAQRVVIRPAGWRNNAGGGGGGTNITQNISVPLSAVQEEQRAIRAAAAFAREMNTTFSYVRG